MYLSRLVSPTGTNACPSLGDFEKLSFSLYPCVPVPYHFVLLELSLTSTPLTLIFSLRGELDLALGPGRRKREEAGGRRRGRPPSTAARPDRRPAAREEWAGRRLRPPRVQAGGRRRGWGAAAGCRAPDARYGWMDSGSLDWDRVETLSCLFVQLGLAALGFRV